ncbi:MAG: hypothetical protein V4629_08940 [Pseudomonadota bacterium]
MSKQHPGKLMCVWYMGVCLIGVSSTATADLPSDHFWQNKFWSVPFIDVIQFPELNTQQDDQKILLASEIETDRFQALAGLRQNQEIPNQSFIWSFMINQDHNDEPDLNPNTNGGLVGLQGDIITARRIGESSQLEGRVALSINSIEISSALSGGITKAWDENTDFGAHYTVQNMDSTGVGLNGSGTRSLQQIDWIVTHRFNQNSKVAFTVQTNQAKGFLRSADGYVRFVNRTGTAIEIGPETLPKTRNGTVLDVRWTGISPWISENPTMIWARHGYDNWDVDRSEIGIQHVLNDHWQFRTSYLSQSGAEFFKDILAFEDEFNFSTRDKSYSDIRQLDVGFAYLPTQQDSALLAWADQWIFNVSHATYPQLRDASPAQTMTGDEPFYKSFGIGLAVEVNVPDF